MSAKIALATAGAMGAIGGSSMPRGSVPLLNRITSVCGAAAIVRDLVADTVHDPDRPRHQPGDHAPVPLLGQFYPGPHKFDPEIQAAAFAWLKESLA